MHVTSLPALSDNYIFAVHGDGPGAVVVDPGDAAPVLAWLADTGKRLDAIWVTHHHRDHTGGISSLVRAWPQVAVLGGRLEGRIPGLTVALDDDDPVECAGLSGRVICVPGHTRGHVAYHIPGIGGGYGDLFVGDTIFGGTIGNLFEGTPDIMLASLKAIRALPAGTRLWCAHEYTRESIRAALTLAPDNARLKARIAALDANDGPTVPLRLEEEAATNPFLRWDDPALQARLGTRGDADTFRRLCEVG